MKSRLLGRRPTYSVRVSRSSEGPLQPLVPRFCPCPSICQINFSAIESLDLGAVACRESGGEPHSPALGLGVCARARARTMGVSRLTVSGLGWYAVPLSRALRVSVLCRRARAAEPT